MKVEEATLRFIRDDHGDRWFAIGDDDNVLALSPRDIQERLINIGLIKLDPLETALNDLVRSDVTSPDGSSLWIKVTHAEELMRKLASDLTD